MFGIFIKFSYPMNFLFIILNKKFVISSKKVKTGFCLFRVFVLLGLEWIMMGWINIRIILNVTQIEEMMSSLSVLIKICIIKLFAHIYLYVCIYFSYS